MARQMEMAQIICYGCRTLLMYTSGATSVRCSCCGTVNIARPGMFCLFWSLGTCYLQYKISEEHTMILSACNNFLRTQDTISTASISCSYMMWKINHHFDHRVLWFISYTCMVLASSFLWFLQILCIKFTFQIIWIQLM